MLGTVLIANRGEIAVRVIRACRQLNMKTIVIFSEEDSNSLHVKMADGAYNLGKGTVQETYLNINKILEIALISGADAVHPGYGFLSESSEFAKQVEEQGLVFIGPSFSVLENLGDKIASKKLAKEIDIPIIPGSEGYVSTLTEAEKIIERIGYPIIIKAAFGGGGKGMEIVDNTESLEISLLGCQTIADKFFGNKEVLIEKYIPSPRHVEIQFLADKHHNVLHIGDRECSIQRSYQKLIEEAPSFLSARKRNSLGEKVCDLAQLLEYHSAGTAEFLWKDGEIYFNEINPRIQVEHPVTEMITGIDLVVEQLRIANEEELSFKQRDIKLKGHAIEFRINAEDPLRSFYPQSGRITALSIPGGNEVRFDTFIYPDYSFSNSYDSLMGKLIVKGNDRDDAITKSRIALTELAISGVITNISLHKAIVESPEFQQRIITTDFLETSKITEIMSHFEMLKLAAILKTQSIVKSRQQLQSSRLKNTMNGFNRWREQGKREQQRNY